MLIGFLGICCKTLRMDFLADSVFINGDSVGNECGDQRHGFRRSFMVKGMLLICFSASGPLFPFVFSEFSGQVLV